MRALALIHRWLGVAFCLLFAMWFATGVVMHFVPYPSLTEIERVEGLAPLQGAGRRYGPIAAAAASGLDAPTRIRLFFRADGPVYVVHDGAAFRAVHASDLSPAAVHSSQAAVVIAAAHARNRGLPHSHAVFRELADHDQWTVPNGLDAHRPLYRIALDDEDRTELYVSSATGEVVRDTTRHERAWNYFGSVAHWIYPTVLRRDWRVWDASVWTLSLVALTTAVTGVALGLLRIRVVDGRPRSPFRGWQAWHHWLGIGSMFFLLTWIFSGWLSMDHGRLFSSGKISRDEAAKLLDVTAWKQLDDVQQTGAANARLVEIEWFVLGGRIYRRERLGGSSQRLAGAADPRADVGQYLSVGDIASAMQSLSRDCGTPAPVGADDAYALARSIPNAPVYRTICGDTWFHVDSANGAVLDKLDASRRAYRWAYSALHTLDLPALVSRPRLRDMVITVACLIGFVFSVTAVVIGWRRLTGSGKRSAANPQTQG
jgi:PepSY-associated TM region